MGLEPGFGVGSWVVTGVIGRDNKEGVIGFGNASLARKGGDRDPNEGDDGGEELGRR